MQSSLNILKTSSVDVTMLSECRPDRQYICTSDGMFVLFHDCPPVLSHLAKYNVRDLVGGPLWPIFQLNISHLLALPR